MSQNCFEPRTIRPISASSVDLQPPQGSFGPFNTDDNIVTLINSKENEFDVAVSVEDSRNELSKEENNYSIIIFFG